MLLLAIMNQVAIVTMRERLDGLIELLVNGGIPTHEHFSLGR